MWRLEMRTGMVKTKQTRHHALDKQTIGEAIQLYENHATRVDPTIQLLLNKPKHERLQGNITQRI
jgi:hypothetical protein